MLIADPVKDFYEKLCHNRILVLVALDVDALAACKILQSLFRSDHIQYTIVPVKNHDDVKNSFDHHKNQYQHFVFLNCGGNIDILDVLQPADDVTIYIIDSHRPVNAENFYRASDIYLMMKHDSEELSAIPDYDDLYRDDEDDEASDGHQSEEEENQAKRRRSDAFDKRRERILWDEKRRNILIDYNEFSYHGTSSALLLFELAWKMSKDTMESLWWGIIGVTDQYRNRKVGRDKYFSNVVELQGHMSRLNHRHDKEDNLTSINCMEISFEHDLDLVLYRHWSLFDSLCHSPLSAPVFKVWTTSGLKRLHQFLAEMGIPLVQCKQSYNFMDSSLRENLQSIIEESAQKYGLENIRFQSFSAQVGYVNKLCASDVVYSVGALLETEGHVGDNDTVHDIFVNALDALAKLNSNSLKSGIVAAKEQMMAMKNHISTFIEVGQVLNYGPFLYSSIRKGEPDVKFLSCAIYLNSFTHHLLAAYHKSLGKSKRDRAKRLPLIVSVPSHSSPGDSIVIGIPPIVEESRKNLFCSAFLETAKRINVSIVHDFFDPCIITLKSDERGRFLDTLITLMS